MREEAFIDKLLGRFRRKSVPQLDAANSAFEGIGSTQIGNVGLLQKVGLQPAMAVFIGSYVPVQLAKSVTNGRI